MVAQHSPVISQPHAASTISQSHQENSRLGERVYNAAKSGAEQSGNLYAFAIASQNREVQKRENSSVGTMKGEILLGMDGISCGLIKGDYREGGNGGQCGVKEEVLQIQPRCRRSEQHVAVGKRCLLWLRSCVTGSVVTLSLSAMFNMVQYPKSIGFCSQSLQASMAPESSLTSPRDTARVTSTHRCSGDVERSLERERDSSCNSKFA
ncbi:hypothetical protein llap_8347 [Limosa lapponica baueri]|uniref:Uncharacterized protein n=1 Tax=Limosa lapponica baueri TaxID=1758121 RepID=A0A2I0U5L5_LIMLA|nr:hypothetical protein llap_8347 [Limosa lapponica baueri]